MLRHQSTMFVSWLILAVTGTATMGPIATIAFQPVRYSPASQVMKTSQAVLQQSSTTITTTTTTTTSLASSPASSSSASTVVQEEDNRKRGSGSSNSGPIQTLESISDFLNYLDSAPPNSLSVVEFYGKNCPLCKRVALKYKKIANTYSKLGVQFAQMEHPANKPIMDVLGIRHFPFLHVYRNGQCVAAHGTESDSTFEGIVKDTIQRELDMTEEDWNGFLTAFAGPIQQGTARIDELRNILKEQQQEQQ